MRGMRGAAARVARQLQESGSGVTEPETPHSQLCHHILRVCEEVGQCPEVERRSTPMLEQVFDSADSSSVPPLIHAIAGVDQLQEAGVCPAALALHAAKQELLSERVAQTGAASCAQALAPLVLWLSPDGLLELLTVAMESQQVSDISRQEVVSLVHSALRHASSVPPTPSERGRLEKALEQAEALLLIRATYAAWSGGHDCPLRMQPGLGAERAAEEWTRSLRATPSAAAFAPCVKATLESQAFPAIRTTSS